MDTVKTPFPVVKEAPRRDPVLLFRKNSLVLVLLMPWFSPLPLLSLAIREVGACPPWGLYGPNSLLPNGASLETQVLFYGFPYLFRPGLWGWGSTESSGRFASKQLLVPEIMPQRFFFFQDRSINFVLFLYSTPPSPNLMAVTVKPYETKA